MSRTRPVPPELIGTVAASIDPQQIGTNVFDPADAQNVMQFVEAFRPLVDDAGANSASDTGHAAADTEDTVVSPNDPKFPP